MQPQFFQKDDFTIFESSTVVIRRTAVITNAVNKSTMTALPKEILNILEQYNAPTILQRHLTLVYNVSMDIMKKLMQTWPNLKIEQKEVLYGAATHDIVKMFEKKELQLAGNQHEIAGYNFLISQNVDENLARFTKTHGNWKDENLVIEDLIVILADNIWKGKKNYALEERLTKIISESINTNYWEVNQKLDSIIDSIIVGADKRLMWQNSTE